MSREFFQSTDCLMSALAFNCCQFGCLIQDCPMAEYKADNADWMGELKKVNPSIKLRDIVVPGTHDSATSTIEKTKPFSAVSLTQNLTITEQLTSGIRYLDVRVATGGSGETTIFHGCVEGGTFAGVLDEINTFLNDHPDEFVFLDLVQEYGRDFDKNKRIQMFEDVKSTFGDKMWSEDTRKKMVECELENLNGKQVVVMLNNRIYNEFEVDGTTYDEKYIAETYGIFSAQRWMRSKWHNTRECNQLLEWNLTEVQEQADNRRVVLNNQLILTPGVGGPQDIVNLLLGQLSLRPVSFATKLYQKDMLDDWLREHAEEPWNLIMLDYVDLAPALISFLIGLNFTEELTITKAAVNTGGGESIDVTEKAQSFVKRGKVLYLTDIRKDFGLDFDEGKLTLAYKLGDNYHILDVDFDPSTEIVVSQYSQNEGVLVMVDPENQPKGCYSGGKIVEDKGAAEESGTILEFEAADDGVNFAIAR